MAICSRFNKAGFTTNTPERFSDDQRLPLICQSKFRMISNWHWYLGVVQCTVYLKQKSGQWKIENSTSKGAWVSFPSKHDHHPPRMASRTAGCAFLTSGGKRPTMAHAMAKATGGSLGDDGIGGITWWAQKNRSYSVWMRNHPRKQDSSDKMGSGLRKGIPLELALKCI